MQQSDSSLLSQLKALEVELHQPVARDDGARLDSLLHDDFHEFGRSGASYAKADVVAGLLAAAQHVRVVADNFLVRRPAADVALLTYRSSTRAARRKTAASTYPAIVDLAALWRRLADEFHQGTPTEAYDPR